MRASVSLMLSDCNAHDAHNVASVLERHYPPHLLKLAALAGTKVRVLARGERYDEASPELKRLGFDVDAWPTPPAGLFVTSERRLYVRQMSTMTVAHEFAHALDCALGAGVYRSGIDPDIRKAFCAATRFVTSYAATGLDEYFAECVRAFVGANDARTAPQWHVEPADLRRADPTMYAIIEKIFDRQLSLFDSAAKEAA